MAMLDVFGVDRNCEQHAEFSNEGEGRYGAARQRPFRWIEHMKHPTTIAAMLGGVAIIAFLAGVVWLSAADGDEGARLHVYYSDHEV